MEKMILGVWRKMEIGEVCTGGVYHADGNHYNQPFRVVAESTHEALREQWIRLGKDVKDFDKWPEGSPFCPTNFYEVILD